MHELSLATAVVEAFGRCDCGGIVAGGEMRVKDMEIA